MTTARAELDACHARDCVNPAHARAETRAQHGAYLRRTGRATTEAKAKSAIRAAQRRRKLTLDQVREIRDSAEPIEALARKLGVSRFAVWSVRAGKTWRTPAVSVFTWRPC